ncbi:hypothetical protein Droror1_Dr00002695 [Drosera rotundifolia]
MKYSQHQNSLKGTNQIHQEHYQAQQHFIVQPQYQLVEKPQDQATSNTRKPIINTSVTPPSNPRPASRPKSNLTQSTSKIKGYKTLIHHHRLQLHNSIETNPT